MLTTIRNINGKIKLPFLGKKRYIIKTYDTMLVSNQTLKEGNNYVVSYK